MEKFGNAVTRIRSLIISRDSTTTLVRGIFCNKVTNCRVITPLPVHTGPHVFSVCDYHVMYVSRCVGIDRITTDKELDGDRLIFKTLF